ncbi:MAG: NAD(P)H-hydrate dehydratase [Candidatus Omnitrophica bacterium]|nr:NAD(P)H-hydrate dehydratase [Candidatus Omnitrophota bacterium]
MKKKAKGALFLFKKRNRVPFLHRSPTSHKGDFGRVFILAGSCGLTGAAHLAGMGALRAGAGLVTVGVPEKVYSIVARREAEVMVRPFASTGEGTLAFKALPAIEKFLKTQDVLALGPGLSQNPETQKLIRLLLKKNKIPVVVDADGLNALKGHTDFLKEISGRAVLTPHPGEFVRTFGLVLPPHLYPLPHRGEGRVRSDLFRKKAAEIIAHRFKIVLVLKGHHTVVAAPDKKTYVNKSGNPGMASGGTGDVLTGVIAALIGQKLSLFEAASLGVYLHGLAGDLAAKKMGEASLVASDLLDSLPLALKKIKSSQFFS